MNIKPFIVIVWIIVIAGCISSNSTQTPSLISLSSPTIVPTHTLAAASTSIPYPTSTPSKTPVASITPQAGFEIWKQVSKPGIYTIQYPKGEWIEEEGQLTHATLTQCFLAEYGGSDMCMSGGCPDPTKINLGDVAYSKIASKNSAYYTSGSYFALSFEVHSFDGDVNCIPKAEKVLSTLQIRPERGCTDRAAFVADVTIPDNTVIPVGTKFIKTWRIKNVGTCTWLKGSYNLLVMGKTSGTEADWVPLQENVQPQQTIDLSMELPAPTIHGTARWEGVLQNEFGDMFGLGDGPYTDMFGKPFWVQIIVAPVPQSP